MYATQSAAVTAQYLSKYLFEKYEDEAIFAAFKCGLPVSTSINPESVSSMVYQDDMTLTRLRIICNYIKDAFGKSTILPEEALHNLERGYTESECRIFEH